MIVEKTRAVWSTEDVQDLRPEMSEADAKEFLDNNASALRDAMVSRGWEVLEDLLPEREEAL